VSARRQPVVADEPRSRPFATYYFAGRYTPGQWSRIGRSATKNNAIRAALRHLLEGTALTAIVHDEGEVVVARLTRDGNVIRVVGVV